MTETYPCHDCGIDTLDTNGDGPGAEHYTVHDRIWAESGMLPLEGYLCIGCLEGRLGRRLSPGDFTDARINDPAQDVPDRAYATRSLRLLSRLPPGDWSLSDFVEEDSLWLRS